MKKTVYILIIICTALYISYKAKRLNMVCPTSTGFEIYLNVLVRYKFLYINPNHAKVKYSLFI